MSEEKSGENPIELETERKKRAEEKTTQIAAEVARLGKGSGIAYEAEREAAAERLGIRVTALDKLVATARGDNDHDDDEIKELLEQERVLPSPSNPLAVARRYVEDRCLFNSDPNALTVRYCCGSWWTWCTTHWVEAHPREMKAQLYAFTGNAIYFDAEDKPRPWSPTRNKIADLLAAP